MSSKTACVDGAGAVGPTVEVVVFSAASLEKGEFVPAIDKVLPTDAKGNWTTTAKIPATAEDGDLFVVIAACFDSTKVADSSEPFLIYGGEVFTVTGAAPAPPVTPVPGDPSFTG